MLRRAMISALPLLAAGPALASGAKKKEGGKEEGKDAKEGGGKDGVGQYVDLASVAVPIVAHGQLVNYVFISVRVVLTASANTSKMRTMEPYFRDALVRAAHRTPFTSPSDYITIDGPRLQATMMQETSSIAGRENIKAITILSQTPKRRLGLPTPQDRRGGDIHP
jgi:hypothetical protein